MSARRPREHRVHRRGVEKPTMHWALLIEEGYFKPPKKRALEDILKGLERKGISTKGKEEKVASSLMRRVKSGILVKEIGDDRKNRWAEPEK
jgi:hypothetical protein